MCKEKIIRYLIKFTHSWNEEIHKQIERKLMEADNDRYENNPALDEIDNKSLDDIKQRLDSMREFYYPRMINTAALFIAFASLLLSFFALIVAIIALFH